MGAARVLMLVLAASMPVAQAASWPEIPSPPRAKVEWVSQQVRVNGLSSRIQHFESELSVEEVLQFYRQRWAKASLPPREVAAAGWQTIATVQDSYQLVAQARGRSPQGSEGMLSVASLSDLQSDYLPPDWPAWSNVRVMQVTESIDGPKRSHVVSMVSDDSFELNVRRMRDEWLRRGYGLNQEQTNPPTAAMRSWIGLFNKPGHTLDVMVAWNGADRRTYITTNVVTAAAANAKP